MGNAEMDLARPLTIDDRDVDNIAGAIGCKANEVAEKLVDHAQAALDEYVDLYLGRSAPTQVWRRRRRHIGDNIVSVARVPDTLFVSV
jgi:hypothetical protein